MNNIIIVMSCLFLVFAFGVVLCYARRQQQLRQKRWRFVNSRWTLTALLSTSTTTPPSISTGTTREHSKQKFLTMSNDFKRFHLSQYLHLHNLCYGSLEISW
eukprot:g76042.t1